MRGKKAGADTICDGSEFFSGEQARRYLGLTDEALRQATTRGALAPGRLGKQNVYTRRDLERFKKTHREAAIVEALVNGAHPLDLYLDTPGRFPLREVTRVLTEWAPLAGIWLVQGPRGSYARWLQRYQITRCTPQELRRMIEVLTRDPVVGDRVRLIFREWRGRGPRALAEAAAGDSPELEQLEQLGE